jgi:cytochrome P450
MSQPPAHTTSTLARNASGPSGDKRGKRPPHHHTLSLLGSASEIQRDPLGFLLRTQQSGEVVRLRFLFSPAYLISHPESIKYVLQEHARNYNKDLITYTMFKPMLGQGLLINDGPSWLHQRRLMQPVFHRTRLTTYGALMTEATVAMLERWQACSDTGTTLQVEEEMVRLTLRIVGQALFSLDLILSTVAQRYQLRLVPGHQVEPQMLITLRPRYGLPMTIHARGGI